MSLTPRAFDVLRYLVEHPGRVVSQDEILEAVWPETYVNPEVVRKHILEIRRALGDQPDQPVFIATFPKRGYCTLDHRSHRSGRRWIETLKEV